MSKKKQWQQKSSSLEEKCIQLLADARINFEREKTFYDLKKHSNNLRFDFYIPSLNSCIELQGRQHYQQTSFFHKARKDFLKQQEYDRFKITYCLSHKIKLYIIPFWEVEQLHTAHDIFQDRFLAKTKWKNDLDWSDYQAAYKFDKLSKNYYN